MAPKKAAKAADGEEVDLSCEQLMKFYRKNCATYQIKVNEQLRKAYDEQWTENLEPIKKVSYHPSYQYLYSFTFGTSLAGRVLEH
jgi:hypothetical protein